MTLYSDPSSIFSHRVRIVLFEKDITVEIEDVDPDNKPDDLLHLNPYNTVPTLVDRDLVLYISRSLATGALSHRERLVRPDSDSGGQLCEKSRRRPDRSARFTGGICRGVCTEGIFPE
jgi:hypothetical protein